MSKSYLQYVCPISGKRERIPVDDVEDGAFVPVDDDEAETAELPLGWGRITVERLVPNPEVELTRVVRREALAELTAEVEAQAQDPNHPQAAQIRAELAKGNVAQQLQELVEGRHPMPDRDTVVLRATFSALSDEAIEAALEALKGAGFTFSGLEGA